MILPELLSDLTIHFNALMRTIAAKNDLTTSQAFNLLAIPHSGISMSKLALKLGLDTSTLTRNVQKLTALGLVIKTRDEYDKRIHILSLSKTGSDTLSNIENSIDKINQSIFAKIDLDDQIHVVDVLESLVWSIECIREQ